jgi:alpha-galactosidase
MKEKIVIVGAGSAYFTRKLVADLIGRNDEIVLGLVDIDPQAVEMAEKLSRKMIALRGAPITVQASVNRREMLPGATAVITAIAVGGRRAWVQDVLIPRKYGIYHPGGDTCMPAGTSRSLRAIPPALAIARDVLDLAPGALHFNYTNPMAVLCRAIRKETGADVIGLCTGVRDVGEYLAHVLEVDHSRLRYNAVGINHLTWFTEVRVDGEDAKPRLREVAAEHVRKAEELSTAADDSPEKESLRSEIRGLEPFCWQLFLAMDAFPAALDGHVVEFFPHLFRGENSYFGMTLGLGFEASRARGDEAYAQRQEEAHSPDPLPDDYLENVAGGHREDVIDIIYSIRADDGAIHSVNLPNRGRIPELPDECVIEAPAMATAAGLRPLGQPPLSPGLLGTLATRFQWVEATIEAAVEGSRDKFVQALLLDGAAASHGDASSLADELLAAHADHLPQFADTARRK